MAGTDLPTLFLDAPILSDGGMGTSLVERGVAPSSCLEALNLREPGIVDEVHRAFADAGASLLLTNTFGANRIKLARHGMGDQVADVNAAGVELARGVGSRVAGSVGPLGVRLAPYGRVAASDALEAYREQIVALDGVDLIMIETQSDLIEMEQALRAAREACSLPVVVSSSFTGDDRTLLDHTPEQIAARLVELGVDGVGINCGQGPAQALRLVQAMRPLLGDTPLLVRPNAGGPRQVADRLLFPATPAYFAEHARDLLAEGVLVVGGCCGATPAHTEAMARALREPPPTKVEVVPFDRDAGGAALTSTPPPSELAASLAAGRFVVAVEMDPPRGFSAARMLAGAETMRDAGADVIDVADSPMARMRMSPWAACRLIQEHADIETVLHFPTRGRNLLRLQGDLLAVHALGIRNVLVCFGDPVSIGDFPEAMDDYDVVPTGLMRLITGAFNVGVDHSGASIGEPTNYFTGCVVSPNAPDLDKEVRLLHKKVVSGAAFALSQPVFGSEPLVRMREAWERAYDEALDLPILAGVLPLSNARHARFLHNEVPGIDVPDEVLERLDGAGEGAESEGTRMAGELAVSLRGSAAGVYLMPQFGRFDVAADVCEAAKS